MQLPLGWTEAIPYEQWPQRLLGWLITALAVSLGAPFWFDMLGKFMTVRASFKPKPPPLAVPPTVAAIAPVAPVAPVAMLAPVAAVAAERSQAGFTPHRWASGDPQDGIL